jgi:hypothetical protein
MGLHRLWLEQSATAGLPGSDFVLVEKKSAGPLLRQPHGA